MNKYFQQSNLYPTPLKSVKAIIFDMDGVLVNSEPYHLVIEKELFARLDLNISDEEHASYLGKSSIQMWNEIISNHKLNRTAEELAEINAEKIVEYFSGLNEIQTMPGIVELLEKLYLNGIPMAVASSSDIRTIDIILSGTGLRKYFLHTVSSETVGKSKPDPEIYLYTAGLLCIKPEECMVVEDSPNGIKAAKSAGMICVAYKGVTSSEQDHSLADEVIEDFYQMDEIMQYYMEF